MKIGETITIPHEVNGSTGYGVYPVLLENLALISIDTEKLTHPLRSGEGVTWYFTLQAIKAGTAKVQFASYRPWLLPEADYEPVISFEVDPADAGEDAAAAAAEAGGWTPFVKPEQAALAAFKEAFSPFIGVGYEPLLVTSQVVNGTLYIFLAGAKGVYPGVFPCSVLARVYKPANGPARILKIIPICAGYTAFRKVEDGDLFILRIATEGSVGVNYTADYVSTQVATGFNYCFAGTETLITQNPVKSPVLITIIKPLSGKPVFIGARKVYDLV